MEIFVITKRDGKQFEVLGAFDDEDTAAKQCRAFNLSYYGKRPFAPFAIWRINMTCSKETNEINDCQSRSRIKLVDMPYCKICNYVFGSENQYAIIVEPYNSYVCLECASLIKQAYDKDM